jgi:branched-chain amino acid transport system ATP-binding protein
MAAADLLGADVGPFVVMTVVLFGGAAAMSGQALARNWRAAWQAVPYALLMAAADRFLLYALFDGDLLSGTGFVIAFFVLLGFCLFAWRVTRARRMVAQYPWLYRRAGLFGWREKG